jgi:hypothetical protein
MSISFRRSMHCLGIYQIKCKPFLTLAIMGTFSFLLSTIPVYHYLRIGQLGRAEVVK